MDKGRYTFLAAYLAAATALIANPAAAETAAAAPQGVVGKERAELSPYLQCVPYARQVSGIQIFGDAHSWWGQAQGRFATGTAPRVGAVMSFRPHRSMVLGHVAAVSKIVDSRTILLDHANWSPISGRRGQVEKDVLAVDVSPDNDWSQVRVWYAPVGGLGTSVWPVAGFIYAGKARGPTHIAAASARSGPSREFTKAFAAFD